MTIATLIKKAIDDPTTAVQYISECAVSAKMVKRKKGHPQYTRVEIATQYLGPADLLKAKPPYVGILVWIPYERYTELLESED